MNDYLKKRQQQILDGRPLPEKKKFQPIAKKSEKRLQKEKEQGLLKGDTPLDNFFEAARERMTGKCLFCGGKTERDNDDTYRRSIAHIFAKRPNMFPSVALNEDNWIELCFWGNSCHTNFDNNIITWELLIDSAEWPILLNKIRAVYPFIKEDEKKNIPDVLRKFF